MSRLMIWFTISFFSAIVIKDLPFAGESFISLSPQLSIVFTEICIVLVQLWSTAGQVTLEKAIEKQLKLTEYDARNA